jgi:hypothetical protein
MNPNTEMARRCDALVAAVSVVGMKFPVAIVFSLLMCSMASAATTNVLHWNRGTGRIDADVRNWGLYDLLEAVASRSGWNVFVEPELDFKSSVKFNDLPAGEALKKLLGDLNFSLMTATNAPTRLYVFRTERGNATRQVSGDDARSELTRPKRAPNELTIIAKPGSDIEALARRLRAKIIGSIPELNAYRLQFEDEETTEWARGQLSASPDVERVEDNFNFDVPQISQLLEGTSAPATNLKLDPPKADACKVVVGFVDTEIQNLGPLELFVSERVFMAGQSSADNNSPAHGTAMANAFLQAFQAAGRTTISPRAVSVDVFGSGGQANTFNVAAGMILAANKGATVINASLGGYGDSPLLRDTVKQLAGRNIPVFAAVGNDGSATPFYPAAYPEAISVTALERGRIAPYANVGTQADAAAPGVVVFSFNAQVYASRGTSVSSAVATGVAAALADSTCAPWSQVIPTLKKNMAVPAR